MELILEGDELLAYKLIESKADDYLEAKKTFMDIDVSAVLAKGPTALLLEILPFYKTFALFHDEEVLAKFRKFGLDDDFIKWFIPFENISYELGLINNTKDITVHLYPTLKLLIFYVEVKIYRTAINWCLKNHPGINWKRYLNVFVDLVESLNKKRSEKYNHKDKAALKELYAYITSKVEDKAALNQVLFKLNKGSIDREFVSFFLETCFSPRPITKEVKGKTTSKKMTEGEFMWRLSPLLRMILAENEIPYEDERKLTPSTQRLYRFEVIRKIKGICKTSFTYKKCFPAKEITADR